MEIGRTSVVARDYRVSRGGMSSQGTEDLGSSETIVSQHYNTIIWIHVVYLTKPIDWTTPL